MYDERMKKYSLKYAKEKIKRIPFDVPVSYYENTLKPAAARAGLPINTFIKEAINARIDADNKRSDDAKNDDAKTE